MTGVNGLVTLLEIRALLSLVLLIGGGWMLVHDGHLVDQYAGTIIAGMTGVAAYWFGAAATLPKGPDNNAENTQ